MLYLHCGWPKTGTTTLQAALHRHRDSLAGAGILYPLRWQGFGGPGDFSHNHLFTVLKAFRNAEPDLDDLKKGLSENDDLDLLLSSESLCVLLRHEALHELFLTFLATAREVMPVTCLWTMRRFDDLLRSLYLHRMRNGRGQPEPSEFIATFDTTKIFKGMRLIEDDVGRGDVVYVKYDSAGWHGAELVRSLGIPPKVADTIWCDLSSTRLNASRSHKEVAATINIDALSERAGFDFRSHDLLGALDQGDFAFADDGPCTLVHHDTCRKVHEQTLRLADEAGIEAYVRFFGDEDVAETLPPMPLGPDALSDDDLGDLVSYLQHWATARDLSTATPNVSREAGDWPVSPLSPP